MLQRNELERVKQELKIFYKNYADVINFLKKNYKKSGKLPVYLTIGQSGFGKTSFLAQSGLDLKRYLWAKYTDNFRDKILQLAFC